jgi:hypothetical protein
MPKVCCFHNQVKCLHPGLLDGRGVAIPLYGKSGEGWQRVTTIRREQYGRPFFTHSAAIEWPEGKRELAIRYHDAHAGIHQDIIISRFGVVMLDGISIHWALEGRESEKFLRAWVEEVDYTSERAIAIVNRFISAVHSALEAERGRLTIDGQPVAGIPVRLPLGFPVEIIYGNPCKGHYFGNPLHYIRLPARRWPCPLEYTRRDRDVASKNPAEGGRYIQLYPFGEGKELAYALVDIKTIIYAALNTDSPQSILPPVAARLGKIPCTARISFFQHGRDHLIFLITLGDDTEQNSKCFVVSVSQPRSEQGSTKEEFDNLQRLFAIDPRFVVEPFAFYSWRGYGLFASEYINRGHCVFSRMKLDEDERFYPWGVLSPGERYFSFQEFNAETAQAVKAAMIALLVAYYDAERGQGLAQTHFSGDDYILTQDFRHDDPKTVLPNLRLAAARGWIQVSLDDYLALLRREFRIGVRYYMPEVVNGELSVNHRAELPLSEREIETGIQLGLKIRDCCGIKGAGGF